jgi:hypothetical protein
LHCLKAEVTKPSYSGIHIRNIQILRSMALYAAIMTAALGGITAKRSWCAHWKKHISRLTNFKHRMSVILFPVLDYIIIRNETPTAQSSLEIITCFCSWVLKNIEEYTKARNNKGVIIFWNCFRVFWESPPPAPPESSGKS